MAIATQDKILVRVDAGALEDLQDLGADVLPAAEAVAVTVENCRRGWLEENAAAFAAQSLWHDRFGHPLADILVSPCGTSWTWDKQVDVSK